VGDLEVKGDATPKEFIEKLGSELLAQTNADSDLAKILADHILNVAAKPDCVASARKAIAELALLRATPPMNGA
jgi:hypothetical protein